MKLAILGSRGIPNHYGGFEQFAEYLSVGLVKLGHDVYVYNSHTHPYQEKTWQGVNIIHCYDPEDRLGTVGQFIYDFNCIRDSRGRKFDLILQLGYTSSSVWGWLLPRKPVILTNMDGLEWKRTKYSPKVQNFLKFAEKLGVKYSDFLVADSLGIQKHLKEKYQKDSTYIPYGAFSFETSDNQALNNYNLNPYQYSLLIARLEPENNIEAILEGVISSQSNYPFLVIGNHQSKYGIYLKDKFKDNRIRFVGAIYDINILNNLRYFCKLYFHGHSVGGTNPSLLEAMASQALICAHQNLFNSAILGEDAFYFENAFEIKKILDSNHSSQSEESKTKANLEKIKTLYNWEKIIADYEQLIQTCVKGKKVGK